MSTYYNEIDPNAAEWLRQLIRMGEIPPGDVDERSIEDVRPDDLMGYTQCHFFAGIGGWPLALRLAGWPEDRPVWTGSCPCQPFSAAGQRKGTADERHLWPAFWWLVAQRRPATVYGEQVASKAGREWLAGVRADLETLGYGVGAADLCAAGVPVANPAMDQQATEWLRSIRDRAKARGLWALAQEAEDAISLAKGLTYGPPHIRQRLFWMADAGGDGREPGRKGCRLHRIPETPGQARGEGGECALSSERSGKRRSDLGVEYAIEPGLEGHAGTTGREGAQDRGAGNWEDAIWIDCADGKARRIESDTQPLVNGLPRGVVPSGHIGLEEAKNSGEARAMRLKGYGNGIVPQVAAEFVMASVDAQKLEQLLR